MSSKATIFLTNDNEHCYFECNEQITTKEGKNKSAIVVEFDKKNISVDYENETDLVLTINNPDSDLYKIFENIVKLNDIEEIKHTF